MSKMNSTLRNAMKRFRQGRISLDKLNLVKLRCTLEDAKRAAEAAKESQITLDTATDADDTAVTEPNE